MSDINPTCWIDGLRLDKEQNFPNPFSKNFNFNFKFCSQMPSLIEDAFYTVRLAKKRTQDDGPVKIIEI